MGKDPRPLVCFLPLIHVTPSGDWSAWALTKKLLLRQLLGLAAKKAISFIEQDEAKTYKVVRRKDATEKDSSNLRTKKSWRVFCRRPQSSGP